MFNQALYQRLLLAALLTWSLPTMADSRCELEPLLFEQATVQIQAAQPLEGVQLHYQSIGNLPSVQAPQIRLLTSGLSSRIALEVQGTPCSGEGVVTQTVWLKLSAIKQAWVYGRNARPDQPVAETQPRQAPIDLAAMQIAPQDLPDDIDGLWLKASANAGMPILRRHLQSEPLVKRNSLVDVLVLGPGLRIRTQGRAMQAGGLGDSVPVMVDGANSSLLAIVGAEGEVYVQR